MHENINIYLAATGTWYTWKGGFKSLKASTPEAYVWIYEHSTIAPTQIST